MPWVRRLFRQSGVVRCWRSDRISILRWKHVLYVVQHDVTRYQICRELKTNHFV